MNFGRSMITSGVIIARVFQVNTRIIDDKYIIFFIVLTAHRNLSPIGILLQMEF